MNYQKTNEYQEIYLKDSISNIDSLINILERQLKFENKIRSPTAEDIQSKNTLEITIQEKKAAKTELESKLDGITNLKRTQNFELECPQDITEYIFSGPLPIKDLFYSVGKLQNDNKDHCFEFFRKLFAAAKSNRFSHEQLKEILMSLLEGEILSEFIAMEKEPLPNIVHHILTVHHKKERLDDLELKLENFERFENEQLEGSMSRYLLLAKKVDNLYPKESQTLCKEQHKIKVLLQLIQGTAKVELVKLRKIKLERGEHIPFDQLFTHAKSLERVYNEVPKQRIPLKINNIEMSKHT